MGIDHATFLHASLALLYDTYSTILFSMRHGSYTKGDLLKSHNNYYTLSCPEQIAHSFCIARRKLYTGIYYM
ncbi:MAG: hypothetical protein ACJ8AG_14730, partial [Ktedonobacteraceae bacterium]